MAKPQSIPSAPTTSPMTSTQPWTARTMRRRGALPARAFEGRQRRGLVADAPTAVAAGCTEARGLAFEHGDAQARIPSGEGVRRPEPGEPGAHDGDIDRRVTTERRSWPGVVVRFQRGVPQRSRAFTAAVSVPSHASGSGEDLAVQHREPSVGRGCPRPPAVGEVCEVVGRGQAQLPRACSERGSS